jgi:hypothetical protein
MKAEYIFLKEQGITSHDAIVHAIAVAYNYSNGCSLSFVQESLLPLKEKA